MKIFVSWSKDRSHRVALELQAWLPLVVQGAEPWVSSEDIAKGTMWMGEIEGELGSTEAGIIVLTQENLREPWLNFEAGALSRILANPRVCTLLIGLTDTDVTGPLANFNATTANDRTDMERLVKTLSAGVPDAVRRKLFEAFWPDFESFVAAIVAEGPPDGAPPIATGDDIMREILERVRSLDARAGPSRLPHIPEVGAVGSVRMSMDSLEQRINLIARQLLASGVDELDFDLSPNGVPTFRVRTKLTEAEIVHRARAALDFTGLTRMRLQRNDDRVLEVFAPD